MEKRNYILTYSKEFIALMEIIYNVFGNEKINCLYVINKYKFISLNNPFSFLKIFVMHHPHMNILNSVFSCKMLNSDNTIRLFILFSMSLIFETFSYYNYNNKILKDNKKLKRLYSFLVRIVKSISFKLSNIKIYELLLIYHTLSVKYSCLNVPLEFSAKLFKKLIFLNNRFYNGKIYKQFSIISLKNSKIDLARVIKGTIFRIKNILSTPHNFVQYNPNILFVNLDSKSDNKKGRNFKSGINQNIIKLYNLIDYYKNSKLLKHQLPNLTLCILTRFYSVNLDILAKLLSYKTNLKILLVDQKYFSEFLPLLTKYSKFNNFFLDFKDNIFKCNKIAVFKFSNTSLVHLYNDNNKIYYSIIILTSNKNNKFDRSLIIKKIALAHMILHYPYFISGILTFEFSSLLYLKSILIKNYHKFHKSYNLYLINLFINTFIRVLLKQNTCKEEKNFRKMQLFNKNNIRFEYFNFISYDLSINKVIFLLFSQFLSYFFKVSNKVNNKIL